MSDAPFGATVQATRNLVVAVAPATGVPVPNGARPPAVADDTISCWLEEAGSRVLLVLPGYEALPAHTIDQIETSGRSLVQMYAASLLADVMHPERAGQAGRALGDALMARYTAGLEALVSQVQCEVDMLPGGDEVIVGPTDFGAAGRFPPPSGVMCRGF